MGKSKKGVEGGAYFFYRFMMSFVLLKGGWMIVNNREGGVRLSQNSQKGCDAEKVGNCCAKKTLFFNSKCLFFCCLWLVLLGDLIKKSQIVILQS